MAERSLRYGFGENTFHLSGVFQLFRVPAGCGSQQRVVLGFSHPGDPPKDQQKRKADTDRKGLCTLMTKQLVVCVVIVLVIYHLELWKRVGVRNSLGLIILSYNLG